MPADPSTFGHLKPSKPPYHSHFNSLPFPVSIYKNWELGRIAPIFFFPVNSSVFPLPPLSSFSFLFERFSTILRVRGRSRDLLSRFFGISTFCWQGKRGNFLCRFLKFPLFAGRIFLFWFFEISTFCGRREKGEIFCPEEKQEIKKEKLPSKRVTSREKSISGSSSFSPLP